MPQDPHDLPAEPEHTGPHHYHNQPEPTPEDLANLNLLPNLDLGSAPDEIRSEKRKKFMDAISKTFGEMLAGSAPNEDKEAIVEGYKEMLSNLFPQSSPSIQIPPGLMEFKPPVPLPPSVFTCVDGHNRLATIDFFCLISHAFRHRINFESGTTDVTLTNGSSITLNYAQTRAFVRYLKAISDYNTSNPGAIRTGLDDLFLSHPKIQEILNEGKES